MTENAEEFCLTTQETKTKLEKAEFFPTEKDVVFSLLECPLVTLPGGRWIEPCAGTGRIMSAVNEVRDDVTWTVCELNPFFDEFIQPILRPQDLLLPYGDFVNRLWEQPVADVLIMNPPFSLTMQFVRAARLRARIVVCLQRQALFSSADRSPWLSKYCPDIRQLPWRPSFRPDGKVDNCDYSWFIWTDEGLEPRREGRVSMLPFPRSKQQAMF